MKKKFRMMNFCYLCYKRFSGTEVHCKRCSFSRHKGNCQNFETYKLFWTELFLVQ